MIVIDASVLAAFVLKEPRWEILRKYISNSVSVDYVVDEVANVIWKYFYRGLLSENDAHVRLRVLLRIVGKNVILYDDKRFIVDAFDLALRHRIAIYDSLYIALAKRLGLPLATLDRRQASIAQKEGVEVVVP